MHGKTAYRSRIKIDGRKVALGCYGSPYKAGLVVKVAERMLHQGKIVNKYTVRKELDSDLYRPTPTTK